ncbi:unnamed protein product [Urochloa humidicola]
MRCGYSAVIVISEGWLQCNAMPWIGSSRGGHWSLMVSQELASAMMVNCSRALRAFFSSSVPNSRLKKAEHYYFGYQIGPGGLTL